jgi:hypothetical protein
MRRAARVDANQSIIIAGFRRLGCTVQPLHMVGMGCPDALVGFRKANYAIEIKDGEKPPSARKLTEAEAEWHRDWRGQVCIVESLDDVERLVKEWGGQ